MSDDAFILKIERAHFRTDDDTGELPAFCTTHQTYHKIAADYGCRRKDK
jgi:hypothetical protein